MEKEQVLEEVWVGSFPGFKFSPTEEELIQYYLKKKIEGFDKCVDLIAQVDFTLFEPWDLPAKSVIQSDSEWFFFSARGRKYPRGLQSRRATESGYWKATGKERNIKTGSNIIGTKRTLVFHKGRAPKGERTEWIMHEYCMSGTSQDSLVVCRLRRNSEFHFHDTPCKESRNSSPGESSTSALADGPQNKGFDGTDPSSSGNSQSVEHNNSECESDRVLANEIYQDGCSMEKDCDGTDDCFADILKDDIIKLDECLLLSNPNLLPPAESKIGIKFKGPVQRSLPSTQPSQGTANRRIRIWMAKEISSLTNQEGSEVGDEGILKYSRRCLMSTLSSQLSRHRSILLLAILTLLVLFLSWLVRLWKVKDFGHNFWFLE